MTLAILQDPDPVKESHTLLRSINRFKLNDEDNIKSWGSGIMKSAGDVYSLTISSGQILNSASTVDSRVSKMEDYMASHKINPP